MKLKEQIKEYLEDEPKARERRWRSRVVWNILNAKYHKEIISRDFFINEAFKEIQNINRLIRKIQQDYPELQGKDYEDKYVLEKNYQSDLGYEGKYYQDLKFFNNL